MTELAQRWRLVLGRYAERRLPRQPHYGRHDDALGYLYDRLYTGRGLRGLGPSSGEREAGLEASAPAVVD